MLTSYLSISLKAAGIMHYSSLWLPHHITHRAVHVLSDWILSPCWTSLVQRTLEGKILFDFLRSRKGYPTSSKSEYLHWSHTATPNPKGFGYQSWHVCMPIPEYVHIITWVPLLMFYVLCGLFFLLRLTRCFKGMLFTSDQEMESWAQWVEFKPCFRADIISKAVSTHEITTALT